MSIHAVQSEQSAAASLVNVPLTRRYGLGKLLVIAAVVQSLAYIFIIAPLPFALMVVAYAISGFGSALLDAQCNTYIANLPGAELKLGILHCIYGVGGVLSPLIATAFVSTGIQYRYFYAVTMALTIINALILANSFQLAHQYDLEPVSTTDIPLDTLASAEMQAPIPRPVQDEDEGKEGRPAQSEEQKVVQHVSLREVLRLRSVWIMWCVNRNRFLCIADFYVVSSFCWSSGQALYSAYHARSIYVGTEVALGGWIVTFLLEERGGSESAGYVCRLSRSLA